MKKKNKNKMIKNNLSMWAMESGSLTDLHSRYMIEMKNGFSNLKSFFNEDIENENLRISFRSGEVGVIELHGTIQQHSDFFTRFFGGVGLDDATHDFNDLINDSSISTIILDIQSGGGSVFGVQAFTELIRNSSKPVITFTSNVMASAAFFIGSAASKMFVADDMTHIGSVGVILKHFDTTELEKMNGVKIDNITAGKFKEVDAAQGKLTKDDKDHLQQRVDELHNIFIKDVALNLNKTNEEIRETFGDARVFLGSEAIEQNIVNGKTTLDKIISDINGSLFETRDDILNLNFGEVKNTDMKISELTAEKLKEENLDLYNEIFEDGKSNVEIKEDTGKCGCNEDMDSKISTAVNDALSKHITRIDDIEALGIVGFDDIVKAAKKDSNKTAGDLAIDILKAQGEMRAKAKTDMDSEVVDPVDSIDVQANEKNDKKEKGLLSAEEFETSEMKDKFDSYENYKSFEKNKDRVRILNK